MTKNKPFSSGSEYWCWIHHNCNQCGKATDADSGRPGSSDCEIYEAIHDAAGGIDIPDAIAVRFGEIEDDSFQILWDCPEKVVR